MHCSAISRSPTRPTPARSEPGTAMKATSGPPRPDASTRPSPTVTARSSPRRPFAKTTTSSTSAAAPAKRPATSPGLAANGSALGIDLSSQMLTLAREAAAAEGLDNVEFRHADAQIYPFEQRRVRRRDLPHGFDVLRRSGRGIHQPPSRVAPRRPTHAPHLAGRHRQRVAHRVPRRHGRRPRPPDTTPDAPSPFALSDPDRVRAILDAAGFTDITFESLHEPMSFGPDADDAFDFVSGLTGWMRDGLDETEPRRRPRRPAHDHRRAHRRPRRHLPIRDLDHPGAQALTATRRAPNRPLVRRSAADGSEDDLGVLQDRGNTPQAAASRKPTSTSSSPEVRLSVDGQPRSWIGRGGARFRAFGGADRA